MNSVSILSRRLATARSSSCLDGNAILARLGTSHDEWAVLDNAERTRRLVVTFWKNHTAPWTQRDQTQLQQLVDAVEKTFSDSVQAGVRPAGQLMYPFSATYWLGAIGLGGVGLGAGGNLCSGWAAMSRYQKVAALRYTTSTHSQYLSDVALEALVDDVDNYCGGTQLSSTYLSPYVASPYGYGLGYPYGFGYGIGQAFPFIVGGTRFGFGPRTASVGTGYIGTGRSGTVGTGNIGSGFRPISH